MTKKEYKKTQESCANEGHINGSVIYDEYAEFFVCNDCGFKDGEVGVKSKQEIAISK